MVCTQFQRSHTQLNSISKLTSDR
uniref:Uncharacterized protein n=1 Tax=Anguilla anguilla TaxID=7936 RepID=A0A0E9XCF8_ANGAN